MFDEVHEFIEKLRWVLVYTAVAFIFQNIGSCRFTGSGDTADDN